MVGGAPEGHGLQRAAVFDRHDRYVVQVPTLAREVFGELPRAAGRPVDRPALLLLVGLAREAVAAALPVGDDVVADGRVVGDDPVEDAVRRAAIYASALATASSSDIAAPSAQAAA